MMSRNVLHYCYGCLYTEPAWLCSYKLQNETLKSILRVEDTVILCFICKRLAQKAEKFIVNVLNNQTLLENLQNVCVLQKAVPCTPPLSHVSTDAISIDPNIESPLEEFVIRAYGRFSSLHMKQEAKDELIADSSPLVFHHDFDSNDINDDNHDDDRDADPVVKQEDDDLRTLLEIKHELEDDCQHLANNKKKTKVKKNINKKNKGSGGGGLCAGYEKVRITLEQCVREREQWAREDAYNNYAFRCEPCARGFHAKHQYDKHMRSHHERSGEHECAVCYVRARSTAMLSAHVRRAHLTRWRCGACPVLRRTRAALAAHQRMAHASAVLPCPHCHKLFTRGVTLRKHVSYAHGARARVECAHCGRSYVNKNTLKAHIYTRHAAMVGRAGAAARRSHVCGECGATFAAPSLLRNHQVKHSTQRQHYCVECDKSFKSAATLTQHLRTTRRHAVETALRRACALCPARFATTRDLQRHTNKVHLRTRPYSCDLCPRAYVNGWSLREHRRRVHEGVRRPRDLPCPLCHKLFDRRHILDSHVRTHTGERPFACGVCGAAFAQRSVLNTHHKLVHLRLTRAGQPKHTRAHKQTHTHTADNDITPPDTQTPAQRYSPGQVP